MGLWYNKYRLTYSLRYEYLKRYVAFFGKCPETFVADCMYRMSKSKGLFYFLISTIYFVIDCLKIKYFFEHWHANHAKEPLKSFHLAWY